MASNINLNITNDDPLKLFKSYLYFLSIDALIFNITKDM